MRFYVPWRPDGDRMHIASDVPILGQTETNGWSTEPGGCWEKPMACPSTAATRSPSSGRFSTPPGVGRIAGG